MNPYNDENDSVEHATVAHYATRRRNRNTLLLVAIANVKQYNMSYVDKIPCRTSALTGWAWIMELLSNKTQCHENLRMSRELFLALCGELVNKYGLEVLERGVRVEESVAIFFQAIGMAKSNRQLCEDFQHSGETISRKFGEVLEVVKLMATDYCWPTQDQNDVHPYVASNRRYHPFKDCIMAINGTHVEARLSLEKTVPYFDKYYLVDAGYPNRKGFLAPTKESVATKQSSNGGSHQIMQMKNLIRYTLH